MHETNILQALAVLPEGLRDCSTVLAHLFSTVGCIAIVAALAAVDSRITRGTDTVRDQRQMAGRTPPSDHVRWQWSVAGRSKFSEWSYGSRGDRIGNDDSCRA